MMEHGAYTLLLDTLYSTGELPRAPKVLFKICGATTKRERAAVKNVLQQFFFRTPAGFSHKRFEQELKHSESRIKAAQENGKRGGRPKPSGNPVGSQKNPANNPEESYPAPAPEPNKEKEEAGAAAAFVAIGFDKPFGQVKFQSIWLKHFEIVIAAGEWLTQAMEDTAQECQSLSIGVPPQFFSAKRDVEAREMAEFERKYHRTPL